MSHAYYTRLYYTALLITTHVLQGIWGNRGQFLGCPLLAGLGSTPCIKPASYLDLLQHPGTPPQP